MTFDISLTNLRI